MEQAVLNDIFAGGYFKDLADQDVYQCALSFLIACFLSIISIPIIINLSNLLNLTAKPGFRSSHDTDTPTLGGIALFASTLIAFFLWPHSEEIIDSNLTNLSMVGLTILFFLGLKDDILALDSAKKLLVQIIASLTLVVMGGFKVDYLYGIFGWYFIPDFVSIPLTIFIFISLINAINLIDGIDGLAGGISLIAGLWFGVWFLLNQHFTFACLAFSLSGSLLGFLRFNFSNTSKIFMGDTGSLIVGFLLSFFTIEFLRLNVSYRNDPNAFFNAPIVVMVVLIVPIFDTLRVFIVRLLNGGSPFVADRNHMHHILIDNGLNHLGASVSLWSLTIINTTLFFTFHGNISNTESLWVYIGMFMLYMVVAYFLKKRANFVKARKGLTQSPAFSEEPQSLTRKILKNL
ncbi:MraY family glycosyltransferase [Arundinibacter roseus]|uniref:Undecaprenyl/decaprenyl-phosphate alpha-N-acetylglucosaminyl 1-phosphate transferase n=1 Tax=Arundinibacter roseus TaxID=2070510 RepID=A0A4R4KDP4_9BACT|nr:MraY family glycosyltransferase [Arundinibacter roseus]TDB64499.1 undecaprenyl/decaprenyl-phosphate alpha-N-acetylglucosaminyl 1-phosphate transferase [Arundinibacter roseus]